MSRKCNIELVIQRSFPSYIFRNCSTHDFCARSMHDVQSSGQWPSQSYACPAGCNFVCESCKSMSCALLYIFISHISCIINLIDIQINFEICADFINPNQSTWHANNHFSRVFLDKLTYIHELFIGNLKVFFIN